MKINKALNLKGLLILALAVTSGLVGYLAYRNMAMERLYQEAAGYPPYLQDSRQSLEATRKLAAYHGRRATELLRGIAFGRGSLTWSDTQAEAIRALVNRGDAEAAPRLANLLQPHVGLDSRKAAAKALLSLPCKRECVRSVLHYLERISRGEMNFEDRLVFPPDSPEVPTDLKKQQQALYDSLYLVLRKEKSETLTILTQVYGLGSNAPSTFALDMASRLQIQEACPYLIESERQLKSLSPGFFRAPRQEIHATIISLKCD